MCIRWGLICESLCRFLHIPTPKHPYLYRITCSSLIVDKTSTLRIETRNSSVIHLDVTQGDKIIYHCEGPPVFKAGITPIEVGPVDATVTVVPRIPVMDMFNAAVCKIPLGNADATKPKLRVWVPWWINVGSLASIWWKSPKSNEVLLESDDGEDVKRRAGPPTSAFLHRFDKPGKKILRFIARDKHSFTAAIRVVRVRQPKPCIYVDNKIECARAGESVSFAWRTVHADEVWMEVLFENRREKVELTGTYVTRVEHYTREFVLVARGNGTMSRVRLKAVPFIGLAKQIGG
jgi:hypothetical protein